MGILTYTTQIPVEKTLGEIEKILAQYGAQKVLKEYDGAGNVSSLSFMVDTEKGSIPIKLPANVMAVMQTINNQTKESTKDRCGRSRRVIPKRYFNDMDQARRVAWRIIKDWLEAQMALIFLQMVKVEQVFLPYVMGIDGRTIYEHIEATGFKGYALEDKSDGGSDTAYPRVLEGKQG
jgi:hypothetical protein